MTAKEAVEQTLEKYPKLNKSRLARMLGVTPQAITHYEKSGKPALTVCDKFKDKFDITITEVGKYDRELRPDEL